MKYPVVRQADNCPNFGQAGNIIGNISKLFLLVDCVDLKSILVGRVDSDEDRLIYSMLNSSIDARVVDYISRDSYHLGILGNSSSESNDIFQFVDVYRNRIALNARGISAAEQIIAQRYWLFNRFYWNRPNRRYISTLRVSLAGLGQDLSFVQSLFSDCSNMNADESLSYLQTKMNGSGIPWLVDLCRFIKRQNHEEYKIRYDHNLTDRAYLSDIYRKLDDMTLNERIAFDRKIAREVFQCDENIYGVIVDLPRENGALKFGDDIIVMFDRHGNETRTLGAVSPIVRGIKESYDSQLRRLRIFVHPEIEKKYASTNFTRDQVEAYMSSLIL